MSEVKKVTKKENYEMLMEIVENSNSEMKAELVDFITKQIESIDAKAAKAKEKAAEKRAEGDELRAAVKAVLTEELQTAETILGQIEGEELTKAKIVARLTQLVKNGEASKEEVKTEEGKKVMAYKLAE
jgi:hypothetical protein